MIEILKQPKNDKFDETVLFNQTRAHMDSVLDGMLFFADKLTEMGQAHDWTKIGYFPDFKEAVASGHIKRYEWYKRHISEERHHIVDKAPDDVNLLDVLEYITDCITAGSARSDEVYDITLDAVLLQKAFANTVEMLKNKIVIKERMEDS